jgi:hypothetical protein
MPAKNRMQEMRIRYALSLTMKFSNVSMLFMKQSNAQIFERTSAMLLSGISPDFTFSHQYPFASPGLRFNSPPSQREPKTSDPSGISRKLNGGHAIHLV